MQRLIRRGRQLIRRPVETEMIILKTKEELETMRESGRVLALVIEKLGEMVGPGVTTAELDAEAERIIRRHGGRPSFKGYPNAISGQRSFPGSICASINEELVHGIPGKRALREGDIISIDVGVLLKGLHSDGAITLPVGQISEQAQRLLDVTRQALDVGIAQMQAGTRTSDVSAAIQRFVESHGFNVVRNYTSHGVGRSLHEEPQILLYGKPGHGPLLRPGMTIALEPMVTAGTWQTRVMPDQWTVVTADGKLSAHFEHTVAVTDNGPWILTLP